MDHWFAFADGLIRLAGSLATLGVSVLVFVDTRARRADDHRDDRGDKGCG